MTGPTPQRIRYSFEDTEDLHFVRRLLLESRCWRRMVSDSAPAPENFHIEEGTGIRYVLVLDCHGMAVGVFLLKPISAQPAAAEVHFCISPPAWGHAVEIGARFLGWVWAQTSLNMLIGPVPAYNRLALKTARGCNFELSDIKHEAVQKNGKSYDLIMLYTTRSAYAVR